MNGRRRELGDLLRAAGVEIFENSRPGGPFSILLRDDDGHEGAGVARTEQGALEAAYRIFLLSK
jgi:hypothetical protein